MADTADLKSASFGSTGSIPVPDTIFYFRENPRKKQLLTLANKFACQEFCFLLLFFCNAKKWGFSLRCGLPSLTLRLSED